MINSPKLRSPKRRSLKRRSLKRRSPKRTSVKSRSPKRRSPKRRSPKRRSPKRRSPKRRSHNMSPKRRSLKRRSHNMSPKRRSLKRRSHNMSPKRNKLINQLSRSSKLKIPNRLTRSIRRSRNMIHSKKSESNLKGGTGKICKKCKEYIEEGAEVKSGKKGWIHNPIFREGEKCREQCAKIEADEKARKVQTPAGTSKAKKNQESLSQEEKVNLANRVFDSQQILTQDSIDTGKGKLQEFLTLVATNDDRHNILTQKHLYGYFGSTEEQKQQTRDFTSMIRERRVETIKLWNYYNRVIQDSYDPLCPDGGKLPDDLEIMRKKYSQKQDERTQEYFRDENLRQESLYADTYDEISYKNSSERDLSILSVQKKFSYSNDSINRHPNGKKSPYIFSPNSIEIHCTVLNDGNGKAKNLKGHVTLVIIRDLTKEQKERILQTATERFNMQGNRKHLNYHIEDAEKEEGEIYHYGIYNNWTIQWWQTGKPVNTHTRESIINVRLNDNTAYDSYFPKHNSAGILMSEYYLHCINNCPVSKIYTGDAKKGSSQLTYKDSTHWGRPNILIPGKTIFDDLIKNRQEHIETCKKYIQHPDYKSAENKFNELKKLLEQEIEELKKKKIEYLESHIQKIRQTLAQPTTLERTEKLNKEIESLEAEIKDLEEKLNER